MSILTRTVLAVVTVIALLTVLTVLAAVFTGPEYPHCRVSALNTERDSKCSAYSEGQ
jgi:hypothetical protein